ncbi:alpha/beta hydrolase [Oryzicola mucosus]|uniref:Alpha/beta hydrolase n=1 Tax=Oryzicola mucosus TaxID=2767425 RepID=A0A8J6Q570_9HYPH|nr:alpha/beta hydrolase [Oryzicola mucosus]MBD0417050.1 alpha/beta hydrolase [Oryzicola mucosus]
MPIITHAEYPENRAVLAGMRPMLLAGKGRLTAPEARDAFDGIMGQVPGAQGVTFEVATVGGVPGWWVRPEGADKDAVLLYFHGGAFVVGSAGTHRFLASHIAKVAGVAAFVADYRLAPEHPFPAAYDDAWSAYEGLSLLGFKRVALAGDSAGGGLAFALLARAVAQGHAPVAAAAIAPWVDLSLQSASMDSRAEADPLTTKAALVVAANSYRGDRSSDDPQVSPLHGDLTGLPPVRIHVGEDDVFLDDSVRYAQALEAAGGEVEAHIWKGMIHVFPSNVYTLRSAPEAINDLGTFLAKHLGAAANRI